MRSTPAHNRSRSVTSRPLLTPLNCFSHMHAPYIFMRRRTTYSLVSRWWDDSAWMYYILYILRLELGMHWQKSTIAAIINNKRENWGWYNQREYKSWQGHSGCNMNWTGLIYERNHSIVSDPNPNYYFLIQGECSRSFRCVRKASKGSVLELHHTPPHLHHPRAHNPRTKFHREIVSIAITTWSIQVCNMYANWNIVFGYFVRVEMWSDRKMYVTPLRTCTVFSIISFSFLFCQFFVHFHFIDIIGEHSSFRYCILLYRHMSSPFRDSYMNLMSGVYCRRMCSTIHCS